MMTKIYLIRHAEAEGNVYRRAHGWYQGQVTEQGRRQLACLAERFRDTEIDALYASDLDRTMETAAAVAKYHDLDIIPNPALREIRMGEWEDRPWGNLTWEDPVRMRYFNDDPDRWYVPGAETFEQLTRRIRGAVVDIARKHPGQTVVCACHGMAIRALIADILKISSENIRSCPHGDNTSVSLLNVDADGGISADFYNDASHLPPELSTFARQSWWRQAGALDDGNLRFEELNPYKEEELYTRLYGEAWASVHGSTEGYIPSIYAASARIHYDGNPDALMKTFMGDTLTGLVELDTQRDRADGVGWLALCYIVPEHRRKMQGVQLIGHAVSVFRALGRKKLRLNVSTKNEGAMAFYTEYGFRPVCTREGVVAPLITMEKTL